MPTLTFQVAAVDALVCMQPMLVAVVGLFGLTETALGVRSDILLLL